MARTAPHGYDSNYSAIMDLIRFGPAIWGDAELKALLFHAERSTVYGKDSDQHSEKQAIEGIYSVRQLGWVRGPAGLSRTSWYRANASLLINSEDPLKTPNGVLRKRRGEARYEATEYEIDWTAVKLRISRWKAGQGSQIGTPENTLRGTNLGPQGYQIETPPAVDRSVTAANPVVVQQQAKPQGYQFGTQQSDFDSRDFDSPSDGALQISQISLELEIACNERPRTDKPAKDILAVHETLRKRGIDLPLVVVARFLQDKAQEFRSRRYPFNPGLLAKAFAGEIFRWLKDRSNQHFITGAIRERDKARERTREVKQMPAPPVENPQFADELVGEVERKVKGIS